MRIQELVKLSSTAEDALIFLALRERPRKEPLRFARWRKSLEQLGLNCKEDDLHHLGKCLEKAGEAKVVYGRSRRPIRITFKRDLRMVAMDAIEGVDKDKVESIRLKMQEIKFDRNHHVIELKPVAKQIIERKQIKILVMELKDGTLAQLEVPDDTTDKDMGNLARSIKSIKAIG